MIGQKSNARDQGLWLIAIAALLGTAVSLYNYVTPLTGINGTPGAVLVIASTLILVVLALILGMDRPGGGLWIFTVIICLVGILGTAFAAYLLNSWALLALMAVCLAGWFIHLFQARGSTA